MSRENYENMRCFLSDKLFVELRKKADCGILLWRDLEQMTMPRGYSREEVWELLNIVRRQTAIDLPWDTFMDKGYVGKAWFSNTRAITESLNVIESRVGPASFLFRILKGHFGSNALNARLQGDIKTAIELSGYEIAEDRLQSAFKNELPANDSIGILLSNFMNIFSKLGGLSHRRISPGMMEELYYQLTKDIEHFCPTQCVALGKRIQGSIYEDPDVTLKTISEILAGETGGEPYHPLLRLLHAQWFFWINAPFPMWNPLVEVLVRHLFIAKLNYPILDYISFANLQSSWTKDKSSHSRGYKEIMSYLEKYNDDITPFFLIGLELIIKDIDEIEEIATQLESRDEALIKSLENAFLNARQRGIIIDALNNPSTPLRVETHRRSYRIAYATARQDILSLVSQGYLKKTKEDKAFVFYPGRRMIELQEKLDSALLRY